MPDAPHSRDPQNAAWLRLMDQYQPALRRLVHSYEANPASRDDLFQEIALALWRAIPRFRGESSERTWLYRIAHNIAISALASRRRRQGREIELSPVDAAHASAPEDPRRDFLLRERQERLMDAVRQLPPVDRQLIVLHLEGLSYAEIEQVAGLSQSAIATRLSRIRDRLAATIRGKEALK